MNQNFFYPNWDNILNGPGTGESALTVQEAKDRVHNPDTTLINERLELHGMCKDREDLADATWRADPRLDEFDGEFTEAIEAGQFKDARAALNNMEEYLGHVGGAYHARKRICRYLREHYPHTWIGSDEDCHDEDGPDHYV